MIAQDTGSAIVGPARADLYLGAGAEAGRVAGRFRHNMRFVILVPKSLDPLARGRKMPLPDPRPSAKIAKLFPQLKDQPKQPETSAASGPAAKANEPATRAAPATPPAAAVAQNAPAATAMAKPVPMPEARPAIKPVRVLYRHRYTSGVIAAADEATAPNPNPRIVSAAAPQAQPERRRKRAVGESVAKQTKPLRKVHRAAKISALPDAENRRPLQSLRQHRDRPNQSKFRSHQNQRRRRWRHLDAASARSCHAAARKSTPGSTSTA